HDLRIVVSYAQSECGILGDGTITSCGPFPVCNTVERRYLAARYFFTRSRELVQGSTGISQRLGRTKESYVLRRLSHLELSIRGLSVVFSSTLLMRCIQGLRDEFRCCSASLELGKCC